jgi:LuxR family maltose regulon positive regulatory protein
MSRSRCANGPLLAMAESDWDRAEVLAGQARTVLRRAGTLTREVDELLRRRPGLGTLAGQAKALRARLSEERGSSAPGASALTAAELRLLPLLSSHLSFPQIAGELFPSLNTIKSQANSVCRKLGAFSRNQAVTRAHDLGLLDG